MCCPSVYLGATSYRALVSVITFVECFAQAKMARWHQRCGCKLASVAAAVGTSGPGSTGLDWAGLVWSVGRQDGRSHSREDPYSAIAPFVLGHTRVIGTADEVRGRLV